MPDITMCLNGKNCKKKKSCVRYMAKPNMLMQSYSNFYKPDEECYDYWELKKEDMKYWGVKN